MTETQLDRIEAKIDTLLAKKKTGPRASKVDISPNKYFDEFWSLYPLKKGKKAAMSAFNRAKIGFEALLEDVSNRIENDKDWIEGFIPHAATYLNGARWEDVITIIPTKSETLPRDNSKLVSWAQDKGFRPPNTGEEYPQYRIALERLMRSKS